MCAKCEPFGGLWMETEAGLKRCGCSDGQRAAAAEQRRLNPIGEPPVISEEDVEVFVEMLASMNYFPPESGARIMIGDELRSMCRNPQEAFWLVRRMNRVYSRWPGIQEMRRLYCSAKIPLDGVIDSSISEIYPDGIPSERSVSQVKQLASGTKDPEMKDGMKRLTAAKDLNQAVRRR
jgi:hypothetical protein